MEMMLQEPSLGLSFQKWSSREFRQYIFVSLTL